LQRRGRGRAPAFSIACQKAGSAVWYWPVVMLVYAFSRSFSASAKTGSKPPAPPCEAKEFNSLLFYRFQLGRGAPALSPLSWLGPPHRFRRAAGAAVQVSHDCWCGVQGGLEWTRRLQRMDPALGVVGGARIRTAAGLPVPRAGAAACRGRLDRHLQSQLWLLKRQRCTARCPRR